MQGSSQPKQFQSLLTGWIKGMNSVFHPTLLPDGQYAYGENVLNRGGIVQTRPGINLLAALPGSNAQGARFFTDANGVDRAVLAIDGKIWRSRYPFTDFFQVIELSFNPLAPQIIIELAIQSVKVLASGALKVVSPRPILIIQDGTGKAGYYDGTSAGHTNPDSPENGTPIGLWMKWTSSRLWVSTNQGIKVSDIGNPLSFLENTYLAEKTNFELPGPCTGLAETPDRTGLIAFTTDTMTSFRSSIRDRAAWQTTQDFQKLESDVVGCVAGKSITTQYGSLHWFSRYGIVSLDSALYTQRTSELPLEDMEMEVSKSNLSNDLSSICSTSFGSFLLYSVPNGGRRNSHTWVLDQSPVRQGDGTAQAWASVWTGFQPVEWITGIFGGKDRCMALCLNKSPREGKYIHLIDTFDESRTDGDGRIACQFVTQAVATLTPCRFNYCELELSEILGDVNLKVFAGGRRGPWIQVAEFNFHAEKGSIGSTYQEVITNDSIIEAFKPQSRNVRTAEFALGQLASPEQAETRDSIGIDTAFQLLFEWRGRMGVVSVQMFTTEIVQSNVGKCEPDETGKTYAVNEEGTTIL